MHLDLYGTNIVSFLNLSIEQVLVFVGKLEGREVGSLVGLTLLLGICDSLKVGRLDSLELGTIEGAKHDG